MLVDSYRYRTSDHKPVFVRRCNWDVLPENVGSIPTVTAFLGESMLWYLIKRIVFGKKLMDAYDQAGAADRRRQIDNYKKRD